MNECDLNEVCQSLIPLVSIEVENFIKKEERKCKRKLWVKPWIAKRHKYGASDQLIKELAIEDPISFKNILRMDTNKFDELLKLVAPLIQKQDTTFRMAIPAKTKLEVTLRYLATGDSLKSLMYLFRLPSCTISVFLPKVLSAVYKVLQPYIKVPTDEEEWLKIQNVFLQRWNFPDCCGALDGKHVQIKCPKGSGSEFINYKGTFSIILFALVDGDYCFKFIEVGANGRASDGAIFKDSPLNTALENNTLKMPENSIIVGDDAFPLRPNLLKPYSKSNLSTIERIFNYRLSRARRVVENAFGILAARFRIFLRPMDVKVGTVDLIVQASCALHNWLRMTSPNSYFSNGSVDVEDVDTGEIIPGSWRSQVLGPLPSVKHLGVNNYRKYAENRRTTLSKYFIEDGAVPWQWNAVGICSADNCISFVPAEKNDANTFDEYTEDSRS